MFQVPGGLLLGPGRCSLSGSEPGVHSRQATPLKAGIEPREVLDSDLAETPENVVEHVVRPQLGEVAVVLAPSVPRPRRCQPTIVVEEAQGHPAQEGLGSVGQVGSDEATVVVGQVRGRDEAGCGETALEERRE